MREQIEKERDELVKQINIQESQLAYASDNLKYLKAKLKLVNNHLENIPAGILSGVTPYGLKENSLSKDKPETR